MYITIKAINMKRVIFQIITALSGVLLFLHLNAQTDGVTPSVGGEEYIQTLKEMETLRTNWDKNSPIPAEIKNRRAAILYGIDNDWEMLFQPQTNQWNTQQHILRYYKALKSFGAPVDILTERAILRTIRY
jgi:hypothetical protein